MAAAGRFFSLLLMCCWIVSQRDGSGVIDGMPSLAVEVAIVLGRSGGWMMRPLAPYQWVNAVLMAVGGHSSLLLLLCCWMGSQWGGSDGVDGMPLLAPSLARDDLGCHGQ